MAQSTKPAGPTLEEIKRSLAMQVSAQTEQALARGVTLENGDIFKADTASVVRTLGMAVMVMMAKSNNKKAKIPTFRTAEGKKKTLSDDEVLALTGEVLTKAGGLLEASAIKQEAILAAKNLEDANAAFEA